MRPNASAENAARQRLRRYAPASAQTEAPSAAREGVRR